MRLPLGSNFYLEARKYSPIVSITRTESMCFEKWSLPANSLPFGAIRPTLGESEICYLGYQCLTLGYILGTTASHSVPKITFQLVDDIM